MADNDNRTLAVKDIYRAYNFRLDLQGEAAAYFCEVGGLHVKVETIAYREGGGAPAVRKLPGRVAYGDITLKWGLTDSVDMWEWLMTAVRGEVQRKNVSIILLAPNGTTEVTRWNLQDAWASEWRGARLDAIGNEAAIETLILAHEGLERA